MQELLQKLMRLRERERESSRLRRFVTTFFLILSLLLQNFLFLVNPLYASTSTWYNTSWSYRKKIIIDHTKVQADLTNFPALINLSTDSDLSSHAQSDGDDILFTSSDGSTKLNHEIEKFDNSSGELVAHVEIPSLLASTNTEIYMYYGNASIASQQSATSVWDSNYKMVQHLKEDPSGATPQMMDSTSIGNNGISNGSMTGSDQVTGKVDGSIEFDGVNDYIKFGPTMTRHADNPLITIGNPGAFDSGSIYDPAVLKVGNETWIYYSAQNGSTQHITEGLATSSDGVHFTKYGEVLTTGSSGSWEDLKAHDVSVLKDGDTFYMWYSGVRYPEATYGLKIGLATSTDGKNWVKDPGNPVFVPGAPGAWDDLHVVYPSVIKEGDTFYMWYSGAKAGGYQGIGLATSTDGKNWVKDPANPVFVDGGGYQADITKIGDKYWMVYTCEDTKLCLASSPDKKIWTKSFASPILSPDILGKWDDARIMAGGWLEDTYPAYRIYYTGNTSPSHTQIGLATIPNISYIEEGDSLNLYPITIETWVKTTDAGVGKGIVNRYLGNSTSGYQIYLNNGRVKAWYWKDGSNYVRMDDNAKDGGVINDGEWHHVVFTVNNSGGQIYVDGVLKNTNAWVGTPQVTSTTNKLNLGYYVNYLNGSIDEVRISDAVRSAEWISTEYNNQNSPSTFYALGSQASLYQSDNPSNSSSAEPYSQCNNSITTGKPDLFEIHTNKNTATLYFAPPTAPYSSFYIAYSRKPDLLEYGVEYNQSYSGNGGVLKYTIGMLQPNTKYYFKIRSGNGCATGNWGNTMTAITTSSTTQRTYYKNFPIIINNLLPRKENTNSLVVSPNPSFTPKPTMEIQIPTPIQTILPIQVQPVPKPKFCILWWCF